MSVNHDPGGHAKGNLKVFALATAGLILVFALTAVAVFKKKSASNRPRVSEEEAQVAERGSKIAAENEKAASELRQGRFGEGMRFDGQGNLLGSPTGPIPGIENLTFDHMASRQGQGVSGYDIEGQGVDLYDYRRYQSYQPTYRDSYRQGDPDQMRAQQEASKQDRELARESSLVFSVPENITGRPANQGQQQGGVRGADGDGYGDPQVQRLMANAMAMQNGTGQGGPAASPSGGRFGALDRPLVSRPGQLSDMRVGGLPEIVAPEGKFIDGVTVDQLETSFHDSPVTVLVTRDFLDRTGQFVLIPRGARILGLAFRVVNQQQTRMFISFHRIMFPDGRSAHFPERQLPEAFNPGGLPGSDARVNNHWFRKFGSAIAMGVIQGLAASQAGDVHVDPLGGATMSGPQYAAQSVSRQFEEVSKRMMDHYSNLAPTVTVKPGSRIKVYLSEDMLLSAYGRKR